MQPHNQQQIEALEAALGEAANSLYEGVLDLNTPRQGLAQAWKSISATRDKLLGLYGVPIEPLAGPSGVISPIGAAGNTWPGKGIGIGQESPVGGAVPAVSQTQDWKSKLTQVVAKRAGRPLTKGEIDYTIAESAAGGFIATCAAAGLLETGYSGEEPQSSKRAAEHAAARAAIQAEFPQEDPEYLMATGKGGQFGQWGKGCAAGGGTWSAIFNAKKRPLGTGAAAPGELDAKTRLMQSMQLLLARPVQKGDIVFEVTALEPGSPSTQYTAVCTLPEYDANEAWQGDPDTTKKGAEMSAATKVLDALEASGAIDNARTEHGHKKKKQKHDQRMAQLAKGFIKPQIDPMAKFSFPSRDEFVAAGYGHQDAFA